MMDLTYGDILWSPEWPNCVYYYCKDIMRSSPDNPLISAGLIHGSFDKLYKSRHVFFERSLDDMDTQVIGNMRELFGPRWQLLEEEEEEEKE